MVGSPQPTGIMPSISAPQDSGAGADPGQFGNYSDWAKGEMAKGYTPEELHQQLQSSGVQIEEPKKKGNWFTNLLPTIGSMAIPAIGALLAPETGGLSLLAAAGLSGAGAAGGKAAENALEGNQVLDKNVLNEGVMGAAGGLAGGIAGKALGKAGGMLAGRAESVAGKTAAEDAIETAANTYKDISPQLQKTLKAKDSLAHVSKLGYDVADPKNLVHVANTGSDALNEVLNRALANSGPVDLGHYTDLVKAAIAKESGALGGFEPVAIARGRLGTPNTPAAKLLAELQNLGGAPGEATGSAIAKAGADPNEIRTLTTKLGALMQDAKPSMSMTTGAIDPVQKARYNALRDVWSQVKSALYDRPELSDAIKGEVGNLIPDGKLNITPALADHLNNVITKSSTAQEILDELSRNTNISRLGEEGMKVGNIVTSTGGKARAAMEAGLSNPGVDTNPLLASGVSPSKGVVGNAVAVGKHALNDPRIMDTLSRIGKMGEKLLPIAGGAAATIPNLQADPTAMQPGGDYGLNGGTNGTMGGNMQMSSNGPQGMQPLISAMEAQAVLAPGQGGAAQFLASIAPQLQKNQLALSAMHGIPAGFANAGGAQGTGGILSSIAGLIPGTAAHTYNRQKQAAAAQIAAAMGISPDQAMGLLPSIMQNQGTADMTGGILANMGGQLAY